MLASLFREWHPGDAETLQVFAPQLSRAQLLQEKKFHNIFKIRDPKEEIFEN